MEDFLIEMGINGITARLKRLNDAFMYQTKDLYDTLNVDIEPNWHMVFLLLEKHGALTITELAEATRLSHPGMIKLVKKMKKNGYVQAFKDKADLRKHNIELTDKATSMLPKIHKYWAAGEKALQELLAHSPSLLHQLESVEKQMSKADFKERTLNNLKP
ncbi:MarR family winged helix-turn-helix transcriptional regulator [Croceivirga sp. JEA036]|uniref:MarR family winged helix-turn-helix transcriptional regulator n=1 Tax=Croceivirga sp. JEA036 TaxID=2721162 RepID=UPI00143B6F65|nr:MarR family transcriptional regulator [Croceivirga sp. JEA036]NJB37964.1 MarR family transcriptional regulator [Croceivirga sp. JEA036]